MLIFIDSREKQRAIRNIVNEFQEQGVKFVTNKLYVGDYQSAENPRIVVDRKQNLNEICQNVCQDHDRFRRELTRAQDAGIKIIILIEHGKDITCLEDIIFWENPRGTVRKKVNGKWQTIKTKATTGETLYKILTTLQEKYGCEFQFCTKEETGKRILEILSNDT